MNTPAPPPAPGKRSLLKTLEIDTRLLGMIGAFVAICLVFDLITDGRFLTPRNIFNLSIQTVSVAIMATGMVFVIVTRHIDLSVGAVLALCSSVMGVMQVQLLPQLFGLGHPLIMPLTIVAGLLTGAAIGARFDTAPVFGLRAPTLSDLGLAPPAGGAVASLKPSA